MKMKFVDAKSSTYVDVRVEHNNKDLKITVVDNVGLSKQKYFCKRLRKKLVHGTLYLCY